MIIDETTAAAAGASSLRRRVHIDLPHGRRKVTSRASRTIRGYYLFCERRAMLTSG